MQIKKRLKNAVLGFTLGNLELMALHSLNESYADVVRGNGHDLVLASTIYYIAKTVGGILDNKYMAGAYAFLGCSTFEVFQKMGIYPGTFDKWDFLAYGIGTGIAFGINQIVEPQS